MDTVKVKPWGKDQGDHVVINAEDFDPKVHQKIDGEPVKEQAAETAEAPRARGKKKGS